MSADDPPTDYAAWGALVVFSLLVLAYSLVVVQQVLLGLLVVLLLWAVPVWWRLARGFLRLVDAAEAAAAALQRLAAVREAEAGLDEQRAREGTVEPERDRS